MASLHADQQLSPGQNYLRILVDSIEATVISEIPSLHWTHGFRTFTSLAPGHCGPRRRWHCSQHRATRSMITCKIARKCAWKICSRLSNSDVCYALSPLARDLVWSRTPHAGAVQSHNRMVSAVTITRYRPTQISSCNTASNLPSFTLNG